jgi:hypothetical protein
VQHQVHATPTQRASYMHWMLKGRGLAHTQSVLLSRGSNEKSRMLQIIVN